MRSLTGRENIIFPNFENSKHGRIPTKLFPNKNIYKKYKLTNFLIPPKN